MRNMVKFKEAGDQQGVLGIFFVRKKSGQLRLIFDTRKMNLDFRDPPKTDLPSADAFTRVETPVNEEFYIGSGDLANAFYTLSVPQDLAERFTLPTIEASMIEPNLAAQLGVQSGGQVLPYLTILPMGWSWALHFCQMVLSHAIQRAGFVDRQIIGDKRCGVQLNGGEDIAVAGYVDNYGVIGTSPTAVNQGLARISEKLRDLGLTVHEEEEASSNGTFVGLHFDGKTGFLSIAPQRLCNIKKAIDELLSQQFCSGRALQLLIGHCTWAMMTRREGLSILNSTYAFIHQHGLNSARLWPSVRQELQWIGALLPLFRIKLNCGWSADVTASDSSPFGVGVCSRQLDLDTISNLGSQCERWRFRFEDAVQARKHALLATGGNEPAVEGSSDTDQSFSSFIIDQGFNEIPDHLLISKDWTVVWSRPWKFRANILNTEARALLWSVEHLLRANRNLSKRLLCFSDNMPLVLGCVKGRAKSHHLVRPLRHIAALCLATGSKVCPRWVVSERNVADRPSRAIGAWQAAGLDRWWSDIYHSNILDTSDNIDQHQYVKNSRKTREKTEKASAEVPTVCGTPRDDIPGIKEYPRADYEGLSDKNGKIHKLDSNAAAGSILFPPPGLSSGGIHSGVVQSGKGHRRWDQSACCGEVFQPGPRKARNRVLAKNCQSTQRLELGVAGTATVASSNRGPRCHPGVYVSTESPPTSTSIISAVHDLHETWRMFQPQGKADHPPSADSWKQIQPFCHLVASNGRQSTWKDRPVRRFSDGRQRCLDLPSASFIDLPKGPQLDSLGPTAQPPRRRICQSPDCPWSGSSQQLPVHLATWRCDARHFNQASHSSRGQTAGSLERRLLPEKVCQDGSPANRVSQSSHGHPQLRVVHSPTPPRDSCTQNQGGRIQTWNPNITRRMSKKAKALPKINLKNSGAELLKKAFRKALAESWNGSRKVFLDLFCGDAGVSKKLRNLGFAVVSVDIVIHPSFDLCDPSVFKVIEGWIRGGCIHAVWLATPCTTWSRARHGPIGSSWGPLRDNQHIFGLPGLSSGDRQKILNG